MSRQRPTNTAMEQLLDPLLSGADEAMVNAFTSGFRVAQIKQAISKALPEPAASAALESAQVVALAILVREQLYPLQFAAIYRPFATVLPGPGYEPPPSVDRQIAAFLQKLPTLSGEALTEVAAVAKVLSEPPKAAPAVGVVGAVPAVVPDALDPPSLYAAAWKLAIATANQTGRTNSFRAAQEGAEQNAPHDGSGIVGSAGVAAGAIFLRDVMPIDQVLLLYEPFAAAFPYESLI